LLLHGIRGNLQIIALFAPQGTRSAKWVSRRALHAQQDFMLKLRLKFDVTIAPAANFQALLGLRLTALYALEDL
jgi:hypothetical protein